MRTITCLVVALGLSAQPTATDPIRIDVGPGKAVQVTVPHIAPGDLREIVSTFLARDDAEVKRKLDRALLEGSDVTLVLTTKR